MEVNEETNRNNNVLTDQSTQEGPYPVLCSLCLQLRSKELSSSIEETKRLRDNRRLLPKNEKLLVFLGTTQVGKSSTLNFISGQIPFVERGYLKPDHFVDSKIGLSEEDGKKIFKHLVDNELLSREEGSYQPNFRIGERLLSTGNNTTDKLQLVDFIDQLGYHKLKDEILDFISSQLSDAIRKKERSNDGEPSIGYRNPLFSYGVGLSKTIVAQVQRQPWDMTTVDLPGSGDIRGDAYALVSAYSAYCALSNASTVKGAAILLSYEQLSGASSTAETLIRLLTSASYILGESLNTDNFCILVTKVPLTKTVRVIKKGKRKEKKTPKTNEEIYEDIKGQLFKFYDLIGKDPSGKNDRLLAMVKSILEKQHFLPVTPLRSLVEDYTEAEVSENVNVENREKIISLFELLGLVTVTEDYFKQAYSSKNLSLSEVISQIESELFDLSCLIKSEGEKTEWFTISLTKKYELIRYTMKSVTEYFQKTKAELEYENVMYDKAVTLVLKKVMQGELKNATLEDLKDYALVMMKKRTKELEEIITFDVQEYKSKHLEEKGECETKLEQLKPVLGNLQIQIDNLNKDIKENKGKLEVLNERTISINEYWKPKTSKYYVSVSQSNVPPDSDIESQYEISKNQGQFVIQKLSSTDIKNQKKYNSSIPVPFTIMVTSSTGIFTSYVLEAVLKLSIPMESLLGYEISILQKKEKEINEEMETLTSRITLLKKLDEVEKLEFDKKTAAEKEAFLRKSEIQRHAQEEHKAGLKNIRTKIGLADDKAQIMSSSDIRKIMIATLSELAERDLSAAVKEITKLKEEEKNFNQNIQKIRNGILYYSELSDKINIGTAINLNGTKNKPTSIMDLDTMVDKFEKLLYNYNEIQKTNTSLIQIQIELEKKKGDLHTLILDIDSQVKRIKKTLQDLNDIYHLNHLNHEKHSSCVIT